MTSEEIIPVDLILPYANNPYKVSIGRELEALVESIREQGILTPLIVRPIVNGKYELVSGHRRLAACRQLGIKSVPVTIKDLTDDEAALAVVDANLQRDHILPSEKAYAFKLKLEALNHQGRSCGQVGHKSRDQVSDTESGRQVQRFIRLTFLIPDLLALVDQGKISVSAAVELSYLREREQKWLLKVIKTSGRVPSVHQALELKSNSQAGTLFSGDFIDLRKQQDRKGPICIPRDLLQGKVPTGLDDDHLVSFILEACAEYYDLFYT